MTHEALIAELLTACQECRWADASLRAHEALTSGIAPTIDPATLYTMAALVLRACDDSIAAPYLARSLARLGTLALEVYGPASQRVSEGTPTPFSRGDEPAERFMKW